jgi:hypothetical protein
MRLRDFVRKALDMRLGDLASKALDLLVGLVGVVVCGGFIVLCFWLLRMLFRQMAP